MTDLAGRVAARRSYSRVTPDAPTHEADFTAICRDWRREIGRDDLIESVRSDVARVVATAAACVTQRAGLSVDKVRTLFMTGGSTALPGFEAAMQAAFPTARLYYGDRFASVASGLGLAARAMFGEAENREI